MNAKVIAKGYLPRLITYSVMIFVVTVVLSALVLYSDVYRPLDTHYSAILKIITEVRDSLMMKTVKISSIFSLVLMIGLSGLAIFYTHKIAGPLYRIKLSARVIAKGNLKEVVKFRKGDVIHPFAESMNEYTDSCRKRLQAIKAELDTLESHLDEIVSSGTKEETVSLLTESDKKITDLLAIIKT